MKLRISIVCEVFSVNIEQFSVESKTIAIIFKENKKSCNDE